MLRDVGTIKRDVDVDLFVNSPEVQQVVEEVEDFEVDEVKRQAREAGAGA